MYVELIWVYTKIYSNVGISDSDSPLSLYEYYVYYFTLIEEEESEEEEPDWEEEPNYDDQPDPEVYELERKEKNGLQHEDFDEFKDAMNNGD